MILKLENVSVAFDGAPVLREVSLSLASGDRLMVQGPSGCGKTTLTNVMLGLAAPDSGSVFLAAGTRLAAVFQEDRLMGRLSAAKNIALALGRGVSKEDIASTLSRLGLDPEDRKRVEDYSGGMKRRVALARAVLARPDFMVLDEPFKGLDRAALEAAVQLIDETCPRCAMVLVTHDPEEGRLLGTTRALRLEGAGRGWASGGETAGNA